MTRKQVTTFHIKVFSVHLDNSIWKCYYAVKCINRYSMVRGLVGIRLHENSASASTAKNCSQLATRLSRLSCLGKYNYGFLHYRSGCMNFKLYFSELNICNLSSSKG